MRTETGIPLDRDKYPERSAADYLPPHLDFRELREAADHCRGCDLYKNATQTVFGEGSVTASLMLLGENPGNEEDIEGHPFVGPAGALLEKALEEAGIPREKVYITNAVKHFKFEPRGKRRINETPSAREIKACRPWLDAEIALVRPAAILCLGATAAKAILGSKFALTKHRGEWQPGPGNTRILATYHPSAALRAPKSEKRHELFAAIVEDLKQAASII